MNLDWIDQLKESIPDYAKDTRLNLDAVLKRSTLDQEVAVLCALSAAFATGNGKLVSWLQTVLGAEGVDYNPALTAAAIMAANNAWYPYVEMTEDEQLKGLPAQLRMNSISTHGGTTKERFEAYALSASIVGKCHFCIKSHYQLLKNNGYSIEQLRDIGRIASVISSVSRVLNS